MGKLGYDVQYDFTVEGETISVTRKGVALPNKFATTDKDTKDHISALSLFLQSIGRSRNDAHMVCVEVEAGRPVGGVFGNR
jgi:hypothetical protein